ncbi:hypothetical protein H5T88_05165 [bacterium]|nr:hypothetical protein [bacterium]
MVTKTPSSLKLTFFVLLGTIITLGKLIKGAKGPECVGVKEALWLAYLCLLLAFLGGTLIAVFSFKKKVPVTRCLLWGLIAILIGSLSALWIILGNLSAPLWQWSHIVLPSGALIGLGAFAGIALCLICISKGLSPIKAFVIGFIVSLLISGSGLICFFTVPCIPYPVDFSCDIALGTYLGFTVGWILYQRGFRASTSFLTGLFLFFIILGGLIGILYIPKVDLREGISFPWRNMSSSFFYTVTSIYLLKEILWKTGRNCNVIKAK